MKYWDASAIIPLVISESESPLVRSWAGRDPAIVTWAWTPVELVSAVERRAREGAITPEMRREALKRFSQLADAWDEVADLLPVRRKAIQLLARHPLRAADSAQLAAALVAAESDPAAMVFVCLDKRLAEAAEREGFQILSA